MSLPGFTGDASLFRGVDRQRSDRISEMRVEILPSGLFGDAEMQLSWQRPAIRGTPGVLTITGSNFSPNIDLRLRISNCSFGGVDCLAQVHTSSASSKGRFFFPGGTFRTAVPVFCGGATTVTAQNPPTGDWAQASTNLTC
jgi:hypothetical protein